MIATNIFSQMVVKIHGDLLWEKSVKKKHLKESSQLTVNTGTSLHESKTVCLLNIFIFWGGKKPASTIHYTQFD